MKHVPYTFVKQSDWRRPGFVEGYRWACSCGTRSAETYSDADLAMIDAQAHAQLAPLDEQAA